MTYYVGIDIGGTAVKGILCDEKGKIYSESDIQTGVRDGNAAVCDNVATLVSTVTEGVDRKDIAGVGIGCPGMIDRKHGTVIFAGNLNFKNFPLSKEIEKRTGYRVVLANDAHSAALGEAMFGAGHEYNNSILVTLGTGIGGGIVINGELYEGNGSVGTEIGHMVIDCCGEKCTCGRRGCFETFCSASALERKTRVAMSEHRESLMWNTETLETCTAKTPFDYYDTDPTARDLIDEYLEKLAVGLVNLANIFRPDVIMIGGGVSRQGDRITKPVQEIFDGQLFGGCDYAPVKIVTASLGNRAGSFGAAALLMSGRV